MPVYQIFFSNSNGPAFVTNSYDLNMFTLFDTHREPTQKYKCSTSNISPMLKNLYMINPLLRVTGVRAISITLNGSCQSANYALKCSFSRQHAVYSDWVGSMIVCDFEHSLCSCWCFCTRSDHLSCCDSYMTFWFFKLQSQISL